MIILIVDLKAGWKEKIHMLKTVTPVNVLVADDDAMMLKLIDLTLSKSGYNITTVLNGMDALREIGKHHYDVVITDIMMPGMEGIELISEIIDRKSNAKILAISSDQAAGFTSLLTLAKTVGASEILSKPFRPAQLVEVMDRLATRH